MELNLKDSNLTLLVAPGNEDSSTKEEKDSTTTNQN
jgi:hypothetical protein